MAKIVKMRCGEFSWQVAGIVQELDKWEAYDFMFKQWVPSINFTVFMIYPWPYLEGSFDAALHKVVEHLPSEATVYAYDSNESFGALRKKGV